MYYRFFSRYPKIIKIIYILHTNIGIYKTYIIHFVLYYKYSLIMLIIMYIRSCRINIEINLLGSNNNAFFSTSRCFFLIYIFPPAPVLVARNLKNMDRAVMMVENGPHVLLNSVSSRIDPHSDCFITPAGALSIFFSMLRTVACQWFIRIGIEIGPRGYKIS